MTVTGVTSTVTTNKMESVSDSDKSSDHSSLKQKMPVLKLMVSKQGQKASSDLDQASVTRSEKDPESPSELEKTSNQEFTSEKKTLSQMPRLGPQ